MRVNRELPKGAEVVIVGGGCVGASIAYHLTRLGVGDVVLLEKCVLGSGPTGRSSAQLIPRSEHPIIASLKWEGLQFFRNFESHTGRTADFRTTGYLGVAGKEGRPALETDLRQLTRFGARAELIPSRELSRVYTALHAREEETGLYIEEPGFADPVAATRAMAERAADNGARICEFTATQRILTAKREVTGISTSRRRISATRVVIAAGVWTNQLLKPLRLALPIFWHRVEVCDFRRPPELPEHPIIADFVRRFYMRPEQDHLTLVGGIPEMRVGVQRPAHLERVRDPDHFLEGASPATIQDLHEKLAFRVPNFSRGYWRKGYACVYDVTPDWHPILSLSGNLKGLFVAAGFSGHGFVMAPAIGRIVAEAVVGSDKNREERTLLPPRRFAEKQPVTFEMA